MRQIVDRTADLPAGATLAPEQISLPLPRGH
jgi:hypothetical protein